MSPLRAGRLGRRTVSQIGAVNLVVAGPIRQEGSCQNLAARLPRKAEIGRLWRKSGPKEQPPW